MRLARVLSEESGEGGLSALDALSLRNMKSLRSVCSNDAARMSRAFSAGRIRIAKRLLSSIAALGMTASSLYVIKAYAELPSISSRTP